MENEEKLQGEEVSVEPMAEVVTHRYQERVRVLLTQSADDPERTAKLEELARLLDEHSVIDRILTLLDEVHR